MINFLNVWLSPIIFVMVLLLGAIQVQTYVMKPLTRSSRMAIEVLVFYSMFYSCAALYFLLRIILEYKNG